MMSLDLLKQALAKPQDSYCRCYKLLDRPVTRLRFRTRSLILCPTRELADQIYKSVISHGKFLSLKTTVVYGGVGINPQKKILKNGVDILIATPGPTFGFIESKCYPL